MRINKANTTRPNQDQIVHIIYKNRIRNNKVKSKKAPNKGLMWQRERDSNPRMYFYITRFPVVRLQPAQPSLHKLPSVILYKLPLTVNNLTIFIKT